MNNILNTASFALPFARMTCFGAATYLVGKNAAQAAAGYGLQAGSKMATCLDKADLAKSMQLTGESYVNTVKNNVVKDVTKAVAFVAAGFAAEYADGLVDAQLAADQSILDAQLAADQSILENVMDQASEVVEEAVKLGKSVVNDPAAAFVSAKTFVGSFIPDTSSFIPEESYDELKAKAIASAQSTLETTIDKTVKTWGATTELAVRMYENHPVETVTAGALTAGLVVPGALYAGVAAAKLGAQGLFLVGKGVAYTPVVTYNLIAGTTNVAISAIKSAPSVAAAIVKSPVTVPRQVIATTVAAGGYVASTFSPGVVGGHGVVAVPPGRVYRLGAAAGVGLIAAGGAVHGGLVAAGGAVHGGLVAVGGGIATRPGTIVATTFVTTAVLVAAHVAGLSMRIGFGI